MVESKKIKVTFLGTGTSQGVPPIGCTSEVCLSQNPKDKRLRSSIHLDIDGISIVIDAGPDFRYQMIRAGINRIDALLFTHEHRDHTAGLDDIRPYNYLQEDHLDVYCTQRVLNTFKKQYHYIFDKNPYPGIPLIRFHHIDNNPFDVRGIPIIPIEVMHYKLPVLGFRVGNFTYITDANYIAEKEQHKAKGSQHLVLNALRKESHISHFTLDEAVNQAFKIGAENTWFTHMSHQIGLHDEVNAALPSNMQLAYDGQVIEIPF